MYQMRDFRDLSALQKTSVVVSADC